MLPPNFPLVITWSKENASTNYVVEYGLDETILLNRHVLCCHHLLADLSIGAQQSNETIDDSQQNRSLFAIKMLIALTLSMVLQGP